MEGGREGEKAGAGRRGKVENDTKGIRGTDAKRVKRGRVERAR